MSILKNIASSSVWVGSSLHQELQSSEHIPLLGYTNYKLYFISFLLQCVADGKHLRFMDTQNFVPGIQHEIERKNIFEDVISPYSDNYKQVPCEKSSWIKFKGKKTLDAGGVSEGLLSAFFEQVYVHLFDGTCMLHPAMNPSINICAFSTVGAVIFRGCLFSF